MKELELNPISLKYIIELIYKSNLNFKAHQTFDILFTKTPHTKPLKIMLNLGNSYLFCGMHLGNFDIHLFMSKLL